MAMALHYCAPLGTQLLGLPRDKPTPPAEPTPTTTTTPPAEPPAEPASVISFEQARRSMALLWTEARALASLADEYAALPPNRTAQARQDARTVHAAMMQGLAPEGAAALMVQWWRIERKLPHVRWSQEHPALVRRATLRAKAAYRAAAHWQREQRRGSAHSARPASAGRTRD